MKNLVKVVFIFVALFFSSCEKTTVKSENLDLIAGSSSKSLINQGESDVLRSIPVMAANAVADATVYSSTYPGLGGWTGVSVGNKNLNCGNFVAGLKAQVVSISGNKITVRIEKGVGGTFGSTGTAYVKAATDACGNIAGSKAIASNHFFALVEFWATFSGNQTVSFTPSVSLNNGVKMYAPSITIKSVSTITFEKVLVSGTNYNHYYQKNSPYFGGYACIPTSYMMARKIVFPASTFTTVELVRISKGMGLQAWGTYLSNAASFAKTDMGNCNPTVQASTNSEWATGYIKDAINSNRPLLAVTNLYGGHIVTIIGLKISTISNESKVYYLDPLIQNAGVKEMLLTDFLSKMRAGSSSNLHNFLRIGC